MTTTKKPDPTTYELLLALAPTPEADKAALDAYETLVKRLMKAGGAKAVETSINDKFSNTHDFTVEHRTGREIKTFVDFFDDAVARVGLVLDMAKGRLSDSERTYLRGKIDDALNGTFNSDKLTVALPTTSELAQEASLTEVVLLSQRILEVGKPKDQERRNKQRKMLRDKIRLLKADIDGRSDGVMFEERDFQARLAEERAVQVAFLEAIDKGDTVETNGAEGDAAVALLREQICNGIAHLDEQAARGCATRAHIATHQIEVDRLVGLLEILNGMDLRGGDESLPDGFLESGFDMQPKTYAEEHANAHQAEVGHMTALRAALDELGEEAYVKKVAGRLYPMTEAEKEEARRALPVNEAEKRVLDMLRQHKVAGDDESVLEKLMLVAGAEKNIPV